MIDQVVETTPLLSVKDLTVRFKLAKGSGPGRARGIAHAVEGASFEVSAGETLAVVGETGCGKTTIGRTVLGRVVPTAGSITFDGVNVTGLSGAALKQFRRRIQFIPQDPYTALNARMRIGHIVTEPLVVHGLVSRRGRRGRAVTLLRSVGLDESLVDRFPSALSGGQRQRVSIARALALDPLLVVCDEPTSALDVSLRKQIISLLRQLQQTRGTSFIFISHDLGTVASIAHRVAVIYSGVIVEVADTAELFARPRHPYTQALISAILVPDPVVERTREHVVLAGTPASPLDPVPGCRFHPRCPFAQEKCRAEIPASETTPSGGQVACHFWREIGKGTLRTSTPRAELPTI